MFAPESEYSLQGEVFHGFVPLLMGTRLDVLICGTPQDACQELWSAMCEEAQRLERVMNRFEPGSEVASLNAEDGGELSPIMAEIIDLCERFRKSTGGLFDIGRGTVKWDSALENASGAVKISLEGGNLDFGGFGKGFLLKKIASMMKDAGVKSAYVDFGGSSILGIGHHPYGNCWKVEVTDPFTGSPLRQIELVDMAMSTSGNQPGYDGHITDPRDKSPVTGPKLVTVLSPDPLTAEVVSTAAMIANEDELEYIKENNDIASIFGLSTTAYGK